MANVLAIHSVGSSLVTALRNAYPEALRAVAPCDFTLISSGEINQVEDIGTTLSLFLYRATMNEHFRNASRINGRTGDIPPLSLDLHYVMSVWAGSAFLEQVILAWAMRHLHLHPLLDLSSLSPEAGWRAEDMAQVIPAELSNEDLMRIWDALQPPYRLSASYVVRSVRIEPDEAVEEGPVVAARFTLEDRGGRP